MKKFYINEHKVSTVECDIPWEDCPVFQFTCDENFSCGMSEGNSRLIICKSSCAEKYQQGATLRQVIMTKCMNCAKTK